MLKWIKVIICAFLLVPSLADAQSFYAVRRDRNLMANIGTGASYYQGDLVDPREFGAIKPNVAAGLEYFILPRISARVGLTWFQLSGSDAHANDDRAERNLSFRSNNLELAATGAVNLIPTGTRFYQRAKINLHAFAGIALLHINPKAYYKGEWVALAPLETEGKRYSRFQPVIPFGLGARIKINPFFNILIEGGYRKTFTDHLDDVSRRRYGDPALLKNDLSRALSDRIIEGYTNRGVKIPDAYKNGGWNNGTHPWRRGNPDNKDGYFIGNVTLQYFLPKTVFKDSQRKLYNSKRRSIYRKKR
jgi:hypothetical protein